MEHNSIPEQVRHFLNEHISSVAQLEILLLLQSNPAQHWLPEQIARELRIETIGAQEQLNLLVNSKLITRLPDNSCFYNPATPELHASAIVLAQAYLLRRVTVISLIFAKPDDPLRAFSDAFNLRKEPPK